MKHIYKTKVYYSDTDAYGVAWHGNYLKWLEAARCSFCEETGQPMKTIEEKGYVVPVIGANLKYKKSAKLHDNITVETTISKLKKFTATFRQIVKNTDTDEIYLEGEIEVVGVDNNTGRVLRTLPFDNLEDYVEE